MKYNILIFNFLLLTFFSSCSTKINDYYSGIVTDESGNPIKGVLVYESQIVEDHSNKGITDENGYFKFNRSENFISDLALSKEEYETDTVNIVSTMCGEQVIYSPLVTQDSSVVILKKIKEQPKNVDLAGTYSGSSENGYEYSMRINPDETFFFVYSLESNRYYAEHTGSIKQINDSIIRILPEITFAQSYMKTAHYNEPVFSVYIDSTVADIKELRKFDIIYSNGQRKTFEPILKKDLWALEIHISPEIFNKNEGSDFFVISIDRKNPITGQPLRFRIPYNSAALFCSEKSESIDLIIKNNRLKATVNPPLQTGSFEIRKI